MAKETGITFYESSIFNRVVDEHACALSPQEVRSMPLNSNSIYQVRAKQDEKTMAGLYPVMVARYEPRAVGAYQPYIKEVLRVVPGDDPEYVMEAMIFDIPVFRKLTGSLLKPLKDNDVLIGFNIQAKKGDRYHPAIRAKYFVPWALDILTNPGKEPYMLADYEPGSDTYNQFASAYTRPPVNSPEMADRAKLSAMEQTWAHQQYMRLGYELFPPHNIQFVGQSGTHPNILALYKKVK